VFDASIGRGMRNLFFTDLMNGFVSTTHGFDEITGFEFLDGNVSAFG